MHLPTTLIAFGAIPMAAAQTSLLSYILPGFDDQTVVGSVLGSSGGETTLVLDCATSLADAAATDSAAASIITGAVYFCDIFPGMTITAGPSTAGYTVSDAENSVTGTIGCALSGTTEAVCTGSLSDGTETETDSEEANSATTLFSSNTDDPWGTVYVVPTSNLVIGSGSSSGSQATATSTSGSTSSGAASTGSSSSELVPANTISSSVASRTSASGSATGSTSASASASASAAAGAGNQVKASMAGVGIFAALVGLL